MQKRSWKTTSLGIIALLQVAFQIYAAIQAGQPPDLGRHMPEIVVALGLILAKDYNATHTTNPLPPPTPPAELPN